MPTLGRTLQPAWPHLVSLLGGAAAVMSRRGLRGLHPKLEVLPAIGSRELDGLPVALLRPAHQRLCPQGQALVLPRATVLQMMRGELRRAALRQPAPAALPTELVAM